MTRRFAGVVIAAALTVAVSACGGVPEGSAAREDAAPGEMASAPSITWGECPALASVGGTLRTAACTSSLTRAEICSFGTTLR